MRKILYPVLSIVILALSASCNAAFHKGEKLSLKDGGVVCRTLDGAVATRDVFITNEQGGKLDMIESTRRYSCLSYSIRPLTFVKYDNYAISGYPEKGRLFASVIEPRSGEVWHIFTEFLDSTK